MAPVKQVRSVNDEPVTDQGQVQASHFSVSKVIALAYLREAIGVRPPEGSTVRSTSQDGPARPASDGTSQRESHEETQLWCGLP